MEVSVVGIILSKVYGALYVSVGQRVLVHGCAGRSNRCNLEREPHSVRTTRAIYRHKRKEMAFWGFPNKHWIMSMKNPCNPIGNRTRYLPACTAVP